MTPAFKSALSPSTQKVRALPGPHFLLILELQNAAQRHTASAVIHYFSTNLYNSRNLLYLCIKWLQAFPFLRPFDMQICLYQSTITQ